MTTRPFPLAATALAACLSTALTTAACAYAAQNGGEPGDAAPATAPTPASTQATAKDTYLDAPQTPGTWEYENEPGETLALFGENPRQPIFLIRCGDGAIALGRVTSEQQTKARAMKVITETVTSELTAGPVPPMPIILAADLDPNDPLLDAMAITKGRFAIEVEGLEPLYLPAWAEVSRVIEDCR